MAPKFSLLFNGQVFKLWLLISTSTAILDDVEFLDTHSNSSMQFSCGYQKENNMKPFAFDLKRMWVNTERVFYLNFEFCPKLDGRIFVEHDENNQKINVTINNLQSYDTDLYICTFHYERQPHFYTNVSKKKFFLYVRDSSHFSSEVKDCICSDYKLLLIALSAASVMLFIILLILAAAYCSKIQRRRNKPSPQFAVPIYEEMSGGREKTKPNDNEEVTYSRPKKENLYVN